MPINFLVQSFLTELMQTAIASLIHQHILFFYVILKRNCEVIQIFAKNFREFGHHILLLREVNV